MIENVEELIEKANLIESESERVEYVMNYFFETVQYDYAYLVAHGYMQETISGIYPFDKNKDIVPNPLQEGKVTFTIDRIPQEFNDSYCFTLRIAEGESKLLNKIVDLSNNSGGDKNIFYRELYNILYNVLGEHLNNSELIKLNISNLILKIQKDMSSGRFVKTSIDQYFISYDIKSVFLNYMLEPNKYFPPQINNGLLKRGVCQHYADYLQDFLVKIGIDAVRITGTSELGHAWIAAIIDGKLKSIDLTRAIFIKDGNKGVLKGQRSSDWLIADFKDTFDMQKTRSITAVGMRDGKPIPLSETINVSNYDEELLKSIVIEQCKKRKIY